MSDFNIGIGFALDGEKEFKAAIREVNSEMKLLASQSKLTEAEYDGNANSMEALTAKHEVLAKQMETASKKVELNREEMQRWQEVNERAGNNVEDLKGQLEKAEQEMEKMKTSSSTTSEELNQQKDKVEALKDQLSLAERTYDTTEQKVQKYQTSLNTAQTELVKMDNELKQNDQYLSEAERSSDGLATSIDEYGNEVEDAKEKTSVFGDVLKAELVNSAIQKGIEVIVEGIKNISVAAVGAGSSFEASMSQVAATMGMTSAEIEAGSQDFITLSEAAKESGKTTKYSASEAAEALNYLALAGYDANKAAATLPSVLNLAAAGGMDLAAASDMVTDSMAAMGMETDQLDEYIDEMARTSQKSNTSVALLGSGIITCAGTVTMAQQSLETMNTELGILANNGIKGEEGGTHLRNILLRLIAPTEDGASALKSLNVQTTDSYGNIRDLNEIMTDLNTSMANLSASDKANLISNIFKVADLSAVNALLKGTGAEFDNLYNELTDCSGAASDMAETMNDNLTGKVTILKSALEALGISAYEKIEGTMKDSVDSATDSISNLQNSMDNGKLGESMDEFAESLDDAATGAIEFAEDALPAMIDGLSWILDNSDLIIAGISGIAAASIAHATLVPAIEALTVAWKVYHNELTVAEAKQMGLNVAMAANPAGILITAIAGLTAAMVTYLSVTNGGESEIQKQTRAMQEQIDTTKENVESINQAQESHKNEIAVLTNLKDTILDLNEKESLSTEEKEKMSAAVQTLNEQMPELGLSIDENTGKLKGNTDELENNIDALIRSYEVQFMQEDLTELANQYYEAKKQLAEAEKEEAEYTEALEEAKQKELEVMQQCQETYGDQVELYGTLGAAEAEAVIQASNALEANRQSQEDANSIIQELEGQMSDLQGTIDDTTASIEGQSVVLNENGTASVYYKGQMYEIANASAETKDKIDMLSSAYGEAKLEAEDSLSKQVSLFDELSTKSDLTTQQMTENIKSQTDTYNTYATDLNTAADLVKKGLLDEGMLGAIEEMGIDGAGYLHELVTAAETDTDSLNKLMTEWTKMSEARSTLTSTMADLETGYSTGMSKIIGIAETETPKIGKSVADSVNKIMKDTADTNDKITKDVEDTMNEVDSTIKTEGSTVTKTATQVATDTEVAVSDELGVSGGSSKKFKEMGGYISKGLEDGITEGKAGVVNAATQVASEAYNAAKTELDVNSPSKKFEYLGIMSAEGYIGGMVGSIGEMTDQVHDAMGQMLDYEYEGMDNNEIVEQLGLQVLDLQNTIQETVYVIDEETGALEENKEAQELAGDQILEYNGNLILLQNATVGTVEKIAELQNAYVESKNAAMDSIDSQVGLFDELKIKSDMSIGEMTENIRTQTDAFNQYASDLMAASGLVRQGLLDEGMLGAIQEMGLKGAGYLHELVTAADTDTSSLTELMTSWAEMSMAKETLASTMGELNTGYSDGMAEILGISESAPYEASDHFVNATQGMQKDVSKIQTQIKTDTTTTMKDVNTTVTTEGATVAASGSKVATDTLTGVTQVLGIQNGVSARFREVGLAIDEGMRIGILDGKSGVINAAVEVAVAAYEAAKAALDVNSPSKKFAWLGRMSSEGFAGGFLEDMSRVTGDVQTAMDGMLDYDYEGGSGSVAGAGRQMGDITIIFQPQTMSEDELDTAFNYVNERFGYAL